MQVKEFNVERDYQVMQEWCEKQDWTAMPVEFYGKNGFIAYDDETPIAVAFMYRLSDSPWCILEWVLGNPDIDWKLRKGGIDKVIDTGVSWAKEDGAQVILTMTKNKRLIEKYKENEFIETDSDMTHFMRRI